MTGLATEVYFWEYAPKQAWWWAEEVRKNWGKQAVVGAMIPLGNCFIAGSGQRPIAQSVARCYDAEVASAGRRDPGEREPAQKPRLAIFNHYYSLAGDASRAIDTARAVYVPTESAKGVWKRSWIYEEAHIQICVRNQQNILAVWHVDQMVGTASISW